MATEEGPEARWLEMDPEVRVARVGWLGCFVGVEGSDIGSMGLFHQKKSYLINGVYRGYNTYIYMGYRGS